MEISKKKGLSMSQSLSIMSDIVLGKGFLVTLLRSIALLFYLRKKKSRSPVVIRTITILKRCVS